MVRRDAAAIYRVWFALTLPAMLAVIAVTAYTDWGGLALLVYWWLEPITDGPILRLISRHLFGETPDWQAALRQAPATAWQNKLYWLTPFRLHLARSAMLPITQLEGLTGGRRRQRAKTIGSRVFSHGTGVTAVYHHLVLVVVLGVTALLWLLLPEALRQAYSDDLVTTLMSEGSRASMVANAVFFYIAQSILHPWFVGAGFGLYINCRTQLEAWDVEVAFRRLAKRRAAATAAAAILCACLLPPVPGEAQEADPEDPASTLEGFWDPDDVDAAVERVYADENLQRFETKKTWQRKEPVARSKRPQLDWLGGLGDVVAVLIEFALWVVLGLLILIVIMTRDRWLPLLQSASLTGASRRRVVLADGAVSEETLPDNIPDAVLTLWRESRHRESLALLYRAAVFRTVVRYDIDLPESATEMVCLRAVRNAASETDTRYFRDIVSAWIQCAYAKRRVEDGTVEQFCERWSSHHESI